MRMFFYNSNSVETFPLSGVTGQEQDLQLKLNPTPGNPVFLGAAILDTAGGIAPCPTVSVDNPHQ
jgi:hypothetical protein